MKRPSRPTLGLSRDELRRRERARRVLVDLDQVHLSHYTLGLHTRDGER